MMKRLLPPLLCAALCLSFALPSVALTTDDIIDVITIDQLTPEQREALSPWYQPEATETATSQTAAPKPTSIPRPTPSPKPTATPTPKPTSTPRPPHSFAWDLRYCDMWRNPKDGLCYAKWENSGNDLLFSVCVENLTEDRIIDEVDFVAYGENAYGEIIYRDGEYSPNLYFCLDMNIKPGKHKYTQHMRLEGLRNARTIHIAITRYHFKDGFAVECRDPAAYYAIDTFYWYTWDID